MLLITAFSISYFQSANRTEINKLLLSVYLPSHVQSVQNETNYSYQCILLSCNIIYDFQFAHYAECIT